MTQLDRKRKRKMRSQVAVGHASVARRTHGAVCGRCCGWLNMALRSTGVIPYGAFRVPCCPKPMSRTLIIIGLLIAAAGVLWPWLGRLGLGRLPGDIVIRREGFSVYVPIATGLLISIVLSVVLWLFKR